MSSHERFIRRRVDVTLPFAGSAEGCLDLPNPEDFPGDRPLAFMVPPVAMNAVVGPGSFDDLAMSLVGIGCAVYRFASKGKPVAGSAILAHYRAALREPGVSNEHTTMIGMAEGADYIARQWYDIHAEHEPLATVLLSSSVEALHLNNLTAPYLVIHGEHDPLFKILPYAKVKSAVHHHQMRYGDLTQATFYEGLGRNLGGLELDRTVVKEVTDWVSRALEQGKRPQEPAAEPAA